MVANFLFKSTVQLCDGFDCPGSTKHHGSTKLSHCVCLIAEHKGRYACEHLKVSTLTAPYESYSRETLSSFSTGRSIYCTGFIKAVQ